METLGTSWGNIAYKRREGDAPTLVFLHGTGCDSEDWQKNLNALPSGTSVLCLDFRGHGQTTVPDEDFEFQDLVADVNLALEILHLERPIIVGHSLGGMVGIELATKRELAGLILLEGWMSLAARRVAFERGTRYGRLDADQIQEIDRKKEQTLGRFHGEQWRAFWHTVDAFDGYAMLEQIEAPVFEIYGDEGAREDVVTKLRVPDRNNIHIEWVPGCGHYIPQEIPEQIAEMAQRVIESCR